MVVDKSMLNLPQPFCYMKLRFIIALYYADTSISEVEECFKRFLKRDDIDIILINQNVSIAKNQ